MRRCLDNLVPGLLRGLASILGAFARQPAAHKGRLLHFKVIRRQPLGRVDRIQALLRVSGHDMGLDGLLGVVLFKRSKVLNREAPTLWVQVKCYCRPNN